VPPAHVRRLHGSHGQDHEERPLRRILEIPLGGHNDSWEKGGRR